MIHTNLEKFVSDMKDRNNSYKNKLELNKSIKKKSV